MQTFTWLPDVGHQQSAKPNVIAVKFGDGYESRTPNGLNHIKREWSLTFTVAGQMLTDIVAFLESHDGCKAFLWQPPRGAQATHICREWQVNHQNGQIAAVSAVFERVYSPT